MTMNIMPSTYPLYRDAIYLTPYGADDSTAIDNAISNCPSGGTIVFTAGTYTKTTHTVLKSNINIKTNGQVTVNMTVPNTEAILAQNLTNVNIEGDITFVRNGSADNSTNNSVIAICGTTDNTFVVRHAKFINKFSAITFSSMYTSTRGIHIYDTASPKLYNVTGQGGTASSQGGACGISIGAMNNSSASPILYDCIGIGGEGDNAIGIESDNTLSSGKPEFHNCTGIGGTAAGAGIQLDDQDSSVWFSPIAYGGNANSQDALHTYSTGKPKFYDGLFYPGTGASSCEGVHVMDGTPEFYSCRSEIGRCNNSRAWYTAPLSKPKLFKCESLVPKNAATYWFANATKNFTPSANDPFRLIMVRIWASTPQAAGTTINIGTTVGGSDIAANVPISDGNFRDVLYTGNTIMAAGTLLYVTPSSAIPDNSVRITTDSYAAYSAVQGIGVAGQGIVADHCYFEALNGSTLSVDPATVTANDSEFNFCTFKQIDNTNAAVYAGAQWSAPFHNCKVIGLLNNTTVPGDLVYMTFTMDNVAAGLTNAFLSGSASANFKQFYVGKQAQIEAIEAHISTLPTAGSATLNVSASGTTTGVPTVTLDSTHGGVHVNVTTLDSTNLIPQSGAIGVQVTTTSNWAPANASIIVTLAVRLQQ